MGREVSAADFTRWFLAVFFVGVAVFYTVRILAVKRRMHESPVFGGKPGTLHWATHTTFRIFRLLILGVCLVRLAWPGFDRYLGILDVLWHPVIFLLGCALLLAGFAAVVFIHFSMGENWRSGTRADDHTRLITTGLFAISRNPMMVCVIVAQVGLFLALPSVFTLVCLVAGVWSVIAQVDVEERLLRHRFGEDYDAYAERTPRWLFWGN